MGELRDRAITKHEPKNVIYEIIEKAEEGKFITATLRGSYMTTARTKP